MPTRIPRGTAARLAILAAAAFLLAAVVAENAPAQSPEGELAERWAPVIRLKAQEEECGSGEPYEPIDVALVLDSVEVAFRGPWDGQDLVETAPSADDLGQGFPGYHLDFPGDALRPGCDYEEWSKRITEESEPTAYARVLTEPEKPGKLALQFWFFYVYNDFNNKHEGDWEMIQLVFDAGDAEQALTRNPTVVGYSQHEGAEQAEWGDEKLELLDGTHPVVYPASGSHANYFDSSLFLGRSAAQGVGCDDTTGPSREIRPQVATAPTASTDYLAAFPWLGFEGHWGERQPAFFNGPTGPNTKLQWTEPITWAEEEWRDRAFAAPAGTVLGPSATNFFCDAVAAGSGLLTTLLRNPALVILFLLGLAGLLAYATMKTSWEPATPLRLERRRAWGQTITSSRRMYRGHFRQFAGIGLVFIPLGLIAAGIQALLFRLTGLRGALEAVGEANASVVTLALLLGLGFNLAGLAAVQAAVAHAMVAIDEGREPTALGAYRQLRVKLGSLVGAVAVIAAAIALLFLSVFLVPIGIWLLGRWAFAAQSVEVERSSALAALSRSSELVRGRWWRAAGIGLTVSVVGLLTGPLVGALLLFITDASFDVVNLVSAIVYTFTIPFVAIATTYLYFDLRVRGRMEAEQREPEVLPAEV